jgi:hypothetical protein
MAGSATTMGRPPSSSVAEQGVGVAPVGRARADAGLGPRRERPDGRDETLHGAFGLLLVALGRDHEELRGPAPARDVGDGDLPADHRSDGGAVEPCPERDREESEGPAHRERPLDLLAEAPQDRGGLHEPPGGRFARRPEHKRRIADRDHVAGDERPRALEALAVHARPVVAVEVGELDVTFGDHHLGMSPRGGVVHEAQVGLRVAADEDDAALGQVKHRRGCAFEHEEIRPAPARLRAPGGDALRLDRFVGLGAHVPRVRRCGQLGPLGGPAVQEGAGGTFGCHGHARRVPAMGSRQKAVAPPGGGGCEHLDAVVTSGGSVERRMPLRLLV